MRAIGIERLPLAALAAAVVLVMASGCGGASDTTSSDTQLDVIERSAPVDRDKPAAATVARSHCPADRPSCRTTEGLITFIERVDPDGDGDVHFVVVDSQSITLPGLTAIDVSRQLRPHPLPGVGDTISAAGPVQTGSYGQSQIHAIELHVAGR
jgi:hypothetical protein